MPMTRRDYLKVMGGMATILAFVPLVGGSSTQNLDEPFETTYKRVRTDQHQISLNDFVNCLEGINHGAYRVIYDKGLMDVVLWVPKSDDRKNVKRFNDIKVGIRDDCYARIKIRPVAVETNNSDKYHGFFLFDGNNGCFAEGCEVVTRI